MTSEELELYRRELERLNEKHEREYRRAMRKYEWDRRHYRTLSCRVPVETALGFLALFLLGLTEPVTGFSLGLNFFNALTVGILGVPGLVLLVLLQMLFV